MTDLITAISTAIVLAKRLKEISRNIEDAEFKNLLADLGMELADVKSKLANFMEENSRLRAELAELKKKKAEGTPVIKGDAYYKDTGDGPFCMACYDKGREFIRLKKEAHGFDDFGNYSCLCASSFTTYEQIITASTTPTK